MEIAADVVLSDRRAALAILLPRVACFAIAVISILLLFWQTARLGVEPMPIVVTRYDIFQGHLQSADVVAPLLILADALTVNGVVVGVGILAGLGAGILAIPSSREVQLIRLIGGHDVGRGSLAVRCLIAPLAVVTAVFAFFEALLPWKCGPLYLTIYALPVLVAVLVAIEFRPLLPY